MRQSKPDPIHKSFWSRCYVGGNLWFWAAFWTGNPLENPDLPPDAQGTERYRDDCESKAREVLTKNRTDWKTQIVETLQRVAGVWAITQGYQWVKEEPDRDKEHIEWLLKHNAEQGKRMRDAARKERRREKATRQAEEEGSARGQASGTPRVKTWQEVTEEALHRIDELLRKLDKLHPPSLPFFDVLGINPTRDILTIKSAFRHKALTAHPDQGGSSAEFIKLNDAYQKALKYAETGSVSMWVSI